MILLVSAKTVTKLHNVTKSDVGLREFLLCGARTPALQKLFRTHLRTAPQFLIIAPAPALALLEIKLKFKKQNPYHIPLKNLFPLIWQK